jgi:hypothetical protein
LIATASSSATSFVHHHFFSIISNGCCLQPSVFVVHPLQQVVVAMTVDQCAGMIVSQEAADPSKL